jgi:hypothetical protein
MHGSGPAATVPFLLMALPAFPQRPKFTGPAADGDPHLVESSQVRIGILHGHLDHPMYGIKTASRCREEPRDDGFSLQEQTR